jgi:2-oxoglutarate dehydrogenase E1 component
LNPFDAIARASPEYLDALYQQYKRAPHEVDERWALFFAGYDFSGGQRSSAESTPVIGVMDLIHSHRELGHLVADLDPLGSSKREHPLLRLEEFDISEEQLDLVVRQHSFRGLEECTIRELVGALQETYSGTFAVEYLDIPEKAQRDWLQERMEPSRNKPQLTKEYRRAILEQLIAAHEFEQFLHKKYVGQKRFSLEGGEALIPLLDAVVEDAAKDGVEHLVMGMPHRGRLNVLTHIMKKPYEMMLSEFEGAELPREFQGDGDVKYHLGFSHDHKTRSGKNVHLALYPNPSHLEAIDPVVLGIARAKQSFLAAGDRRRVMPVLLHGDAAFTGQGVVYETVAMSRLRGFTVGGTIHVIVNNQIGFTTSPKDYSINGYPSDIAKLIRAPVFHVNGDDPEAAVQAARLATGFRQAFGVDVFIDFVCYRRWGHNELDEPAYTQPRMYQKIRAKTPVHELYADRLVEERVITKADVEDIKSEVRQHLENALSYAREFRPRQKVYALGGRWEGLGWAGSDWSADTRVPEQTLHKLADALHKLPDGFVPHKNIRKLLDDRRQMVQSGQGIDWGCAETLAFASLLGQGIDIRLSGQDSERGTFSHRHAVIHDSVNGETYVPLNHLGLERQGVFLPVNSLLSEAAVLGFEYGITSADPQRLVIWEAQFGDFANGAQVVFDQFVSSAESKWQRMSGLTILLPHGYEGQGPEHSSARLERFLQLCAEGNMQVVNCSTPAQFFHVLRRQQLRSFRKPLIVMSPKSLLRHPKAVSTLSELANGTFQTVIDDPSPPALDRVERLILCSGKIYYALEKMREETKASNAAIVRVEQLYPFPSNELSRIVARHAKTREVFWVQEEPENQGAWSSVAPRLEALLGGEIPVSYVGREEAASPATGSYSQHHAEEEALLKEAFLRPAKLRQERGRVEDHQKATG